MATSGVQAAKFVIIFGITSAICIFCSPIIIPVFIPLLVILIGSLLLDAQGTVAMILQWYHQWNLLKIKYYYKSTPSDRSHERLITGQAWNEFCDTLKGAQSAISNGPQDALSQAEGYRFLARVVECIIIICELHTHHATYLCVLYIHTDKSCVSLIFGICGSKCPQIACIGW